MVRNAGYDADVDNLIQGGDTMVKRVEAFKANDGSLHETEEDAKLRDLIDVFCAKHPASHELWSLLNIAIILNRDDIIAQIEKDWVLTKPTLTL